MLLPNSAAETLVKATIQGDSLIIVESNFSKDSTIMAYYEVYDSANLKNYFLVCPTGFKGEVEIPI